MYNTGTGSVESDGHGHDNSPLAAVGDREAVGSRHSAQTFAPIATIILTKVERFLVTNNQVLFRRNTSKFDSKKILTFILIYGII